MDPAPTRSLHRVAGRSRALAEPAIRAWSRVARQRRASTTWRPPCARSPTDPALVEAGFLALGMGGKDAVDLVAAASPATRRWRLRRSCGCSSTRSVDLPPLTVASPAAHAVASLAHQMVASGEAPAVLRLGDLGSLDEVAAFVAELVVVPGRVTERVLDAVARHHPDRRVARAARKALLKLRTAQVV